MRSSEETLRNPNVVHGCVQGNPAQTSVGSVFPTNCPIVRRGWLLRQGCTESLTGNKLCLGGRGLEFLESPGNQWPGLTWSTQDAEVTTAVPHAEGRQPASPSCCKWRKKARRTLAVVIILHFWTVSTSQMEGRWNDLNSSRKQKNWEQSTFSARAWNLEYVCSLSSSIQVYLTLSAPSKTS